MRTQLKGQATPDGYGMVITLMFISISLIIGVLVYDAVYRSTVAETFASESVGNFTGVNVTSQLTDVLNNLPVYFGPAFADGTANATATLVRNDGTIETLTLEGGPLCSASGACTNTSSVFNLTTTGVVHVNSTNAGEVFISYSNQDASPSAHASFNSINNSVYSAFNLAVVGLIILAASVILGYLLIFRKTA